MDDFGFEEMLGKLELGKIYNMKCEEGLCLLPDNSIDLILTDPPYNISMKSNFHTLGGRQGVDFGDWDKGFDQSTWLDIACSKVKKGGSMVIFNSYQNIGEMSSVLESNGFQIKELLIWKKPNPMPRNRDRLYVTSIEVALWAVKGKGWTFNRSRSNYENGIFEYPTVSSKERIHPTQKPITLISDLLSIHSNEGDIVVDCFMGSGTTGLCCEMLNRKWLGFELDDTNFKLSTSRVDDYISSTR